MTQQSKLRLDGDLYIQLKSTPGFHETNMLYLFELGFNPQMHVWSCVSFYQSKVEADQQLVICPVKFSKWMRKQKFIQANILKCITPTWA